jgi:DNA repair protein RadC
VTYPIREMPADDRPRERLLKHGPRVLSDAELLAIILGTGAQGKNVVQLAGELLAGGVLALRDRELTALVRTRGVGPAKAARIAAMMEMARRVATAPMEQSPRFEPSVFGSKLVKGFGHHLQERLGAAILDSRHRVLKEREIFVGTIDRALVSTNDIVRFALLERGKGVVIYHNHPSGDPTPSEADLTFTEKLKQSLAMVDVDLVDHLVVGSHRYYSMRDRGQI